MTTVRQIYDALNEWAPFSLTEEGDNTGLLAGSPDTPVHKALLTLDMTMDAVREAVSAGAQLLLSHHPVIYHPLYKLTEDDPACFMLKNGLAALCAHTNLDMAEGGVNDALTAALGLPAGGQLLDVVHSVPYKQVVVFVPETHAGSVYEAICEAGGGEQGDYTKCAFSTPGTGRFLPGDEASPFIGQVGKVEKVDEIRLEMLVKPDRLKGVLSAMKAAHPYEEPAFQVLDNHALYEEQGFGRIIELQEPVSPRQLAKKIKTALDCTSVRFVDTDRPLKRIAICSGGAGSMLGKALKKGADAYITGDVKHDQLITARNAGIALFDAGHFHTETVVLKPLLEKLSACFPQVDFFIAKANRDPASYEI